MCKSEGESKMEHKIDRQIDVASAVMQVQKGGKLKGNDYSFIALQWPLISQWSIGLIGLIQKGKGDEKELGVVPLVIYYCKIQDNLAHFITRMHVIHV